MRTTVIALTLSDALHTEIRRGLGRDKRWEVRQVRSVEESLQPAGVSDRQIILCDAELPDDGWKEVVRQQSGTPVVVVSRLADESMWQHVLDHGAFDLLTVPLEAPEVLRVLQAAAARAD